MQVALDDHVDGAVEKKSAERFDDRGVEFLNLIRFVSGPLQFVRIDGEVTARLCLRRRGGGEELILPEFAGLDLDSKVGQLVRRKVGISRFFITFLILFRKLLSNSIRTQNLLPPPKYRDAHRNQASVAFFNRLLTVTKRQAFFDLLSAL